MPAPVADAVTERLHIPTIGIGAGRGADGQVLVFFVLVVAAVEVVIGLAIIVDIFRSRDTVDVDDVDLLRG